MSQEKWSGWTAALISTVAMSTVPVVASFAIHTGMNPTTLNAARFTLTGLLLAATYYLARSQRLKMDRRARIYCITAGLINSVGTLSYFWSLTRINASISSMLISIYPLFVMGILALRGEIFSHRQVIRLVVGLGGVYFLLDPKGNVDHWGALLALISAVAFSINLVIIQWYLKGYPNTQVTFYTTTTMAGSLVGFWLIQGAEWHAPGWQSWLAIIFLAVIGTYLARLLAYRSIKDIGSAQLSLLSPLETFLAVAWSLIFLQERLTMVQMLGGILIIASALLAIERRPGRMSYDSGKVPL